MNRLFHIFLGGLIFFIFTPELGNSSTKEGTRILAGSLDISNQTTLNDDGQSFSNYMINPIYGRFFWDDLAIGPFFNYTQRDVRNSDEPQTEMDLGAFSRLYTGVNLFFEGSMRYSRQQEPSLGETDHGGWIGAAMGYTVFLTDHLAMEPRAFADFGFAGYTGNQELVRTGLTIGFTGFLQSANDDENEEDQ